jgi:methyl-accepting chemotaxis protein
MKAIPLSIGLRVTLAFGTVLATIGLLVAAVLWQLSASLASAERIGGGVQTLAGTASLDALAKDNAIASMVILLSPSEKQQAKLANEITARDERMVRELESIAGRLSGSPEDAELLEAVRKRHATQRAGVQRIVRLVQSGKQAEAAFSADEEMIPMMAPFLDAIAKLDARQFETLRASEAEGEALLASMRGTVIGAGLAAALLAAAAGIWLVRSVTGPLRHAVTVAERVAGGDLTVRANPSGRDEVSQLLGALDRMTVALCSIVTDVREGSQTIAVRSQEIAAGTVELSQRTEQAASNLQTTASSMDELNSAVRQTSDNAELATQLAAGTQASVVDGGRLMERAVATMDEISTSSRRIAEITSVIDGIAFQTNILALNAAVEAARAGDQGRGFAVVASEVRSLAQRSATAAREVRQLIDASAARIDEGAALVKEAGARVAQTVEQVGRMSGLIGEVAGAAREQTSGIDAVHRAVAELDELTQRNAAMAEESTAGAEALNESARALVGTVGAFRVGGEAVHV